LHNLKIFSTYGPFLLSACLLLGSCSAFKPQSPAQSSVNSKKGSPFLENITINPDGSPAKQQGPSEEKMPALVDNYNAPMDINTGISINEAASTQFRYAILLNTEVEYLSNKALYDVINEWWGAPYKIGGMTKKGVDCSAFVQTIMGGVYELPLPRTASEQKAICTEIRKEELTEGDLVFFNTRGGVSHVGVYLHNNKFVHASTSGGVTISDLAEPYWEKRFIGAGKPTRSFEATSAK
jgi:NlpC/P60 family